MDERKADLGTVVLVFARRSVCLCVCVVHADTGGDLSASSCAVRAPADACAEARFAIKSNRERVGGRIFPPSRFQPSQSFDPAGGKLCALLAPLGEGEGGGGIQQDCWW